MGQRTEYAPGTPSWVDLATTDIGGAKEFYSSLFGWKMVDNPAGDAGTYTMAKLGGKDVCGLSSQPPQMREQNIPPTWTTYFTVADVEATAKKVEALGGKVQTPAFDVMDAGRMALLADPQGAVFAVWQAKEHIGAGVVNEPGTFTWNELNAKDREGAAKFYAELFGYTMETSDFGPTKYTSVKLGDRSIAGMLEMNPEWGDMPSQWAVYFAVADCDASAKQVVELGGKVLMQPTDIPEVGRFAVIEDPQGGSLTIIALTNADD